MAVHLATSSDYLRRTASLLPASGNSTVCFWVKFDTVAADPNYDTAYIILDDPGVYTDYTAIYADDGTGAGAGFQLQVNGVKVQTTAPTAATWYHVAWVQSGTSQRFYVNGTLIGSTTHNRAAVVNGFEYLGNDTFSAGNLDFAYCREWTAALTQAQILVEMQATTAVHTANLYMDCPFTSTILDVSGNGHNWTQIGSGTFVAGPSFPSNSSAATATELSNLPMTVTQDWGDGVYAWYSYTSVPADILVGFWAFSGLSDTLTTQIQYGSPSSLLLLNTAINVPFEVPTDGGDTFYFQVSSGANPPTADVVMSGQLSPTNAVPIGSIGINDDGNFSVLGDSQTTEFPAVFMDAATGNALSFRLSAAGEAGTVLPTTGQVCLEDVDTQTVQIFPASLGTPTVTKAKTDFAAAGSAQVISSDQTTQFYVGGFASVGTSHVKTLSPDGVIGTTDYAIPTTIGTQFKALAPSRDNTILYYAITSVGAAVKRWNLTTNMAGSDFLAGVASHTVCSDILVLADTNVIIGHKKTAAVFDDSVVVYDAAATPITTITIGPHVLNRMCHALDDPDSFWIWTYLTNAGVFTGVDRFTNVDASTGATISTFDIANFEGGVYAPDAVADPIRFGHSFSCPMWINREGITPPTPVGEPVDYIIRRERWWPHISSEQFRQFFSMLQVDLYAGNGVTAGPVEAPVQGEDPLLEVDWSDDGGHTWSSIHFVQTGKIGAYRQRAILRRMGYSRDRVYRIAVSDPNQWIVVNGYLQAVLGTS